MTSESVTISTSAPPRSRSARREPYRSGPSKQAMSSYFDDAPFADNLVSVKTELSQQQTAGWTPGPPVMSGLGCRIHADQLIPVAEGISLGADIAAPATPGRYPAVVVFSAYSH